MSVDELRSARFGADLANTVLSSYKHMQRQFTLARHMPCKGLRHLETISFAQKVIIQCQYRHDVKLGLQNRHAAFVDTATAFERKISHAASCANAQCIDPSIGLSNFADSCKPAHDALMRAMTDFSTRTTGVHRQHRRHHSVLETSGLRYVKTHPERRLASLEASFRKEASKTGVPSAVIDTFAWDGPGQREHASLIQGDTQTSEVLGICKAARELASDELDFCWGRNDHPEWVLIRSCWRKIRIIRDRTVRWMAHVGAQFADARLRSVVGLACMLLDGAELGFYSRPPAAVRSWIHTADPLDYLLLASIDEYMGWVFPFATHDLESPVLLHLLSIHACNYNSDSVQHMPIALRVCSGISFAGMSASGMLNAVRVSWPAAAPVPAAAPAVTPEAARVLTDMMDKWEASLATGSDIECMHAESRVIFAIGREAVRQLEPNGGLLSAEYDSSLQKWEELFVRILSPDAPAGDPDRLAIELTKHAVILQLIICFCTEFAATVIAFDRTEFLHCFQAAMAEADPGLETPSAGAAPAPRGRMHTVPKVFLGAALGKLMDWTLGYFTGAGGSPAAAAGSVALSTLTAGGLAGAGGIISSAAGGILSSVAPYALVAAGTAGVSGLVGVAAGQFMIAGTVIAGITGMAGILIVYLIPKSLTQASIVDQLAYAHPGIDFMVRIVPVLSIAMGLAEFTYKYQQTQFNRRIIEAMEKAAERLGPIDMRSRENRERLLREMRSFSGRDRIDFDNDEITFPAGNLTRESVRSLLKLDLPGSRKNWKIASTVQGLILTATVGFAGYFFYTSDMMHIHDGILGSRYRDEDIAIRHAEFYLGLSVFSSKLVTDALTASFLRHTAVWAADRVFRSAKYRLDRIFTERTDAVVREVAFRAMNKAEFGSLSVKNIADSVLADSTAVVRWDLNDPAKRIVAATYWDIENGIFSNSVTAFKGRRTQLTEWWGARVANLVSPIDTVFVDEQIGKQFQRAETLGKLRAAFESATQAADLSPTNADLADAAEKARNAFFKNLNQAEMQISLRLESNLTSAIGSIVSMTLSFVKTLADRGTRDQDVYYGNSAAAGALAQIAESERETALQLRQNPELKNDEGYMRLVTTRESALRAQASDSLARRITPPTVQQATVQAAVAVGRVAAPYVISAGKKAVAVAAPAVKAALEHAAQEGQKAKWLGAVRGMLWDEKIVVPEKCAFVFTVLFSAIDSGINWNRVPDAELAYTAGQAKFSFDELLQMLQTFPVPVGLASRARVFLRQQWPSYEPRARTVYVNKYRFKYLDAVAEPSDEKRRGLTAPK